MITIPIIPTVQSINIKEEIKSILAQDIKEIQKHYKEKYLINDDPIPLLWIIRIIIALILLPFTIFTAPFLYIMTFIENIIDQVLITIDDFSSIPSFILNRFIVLPLLLIMYTFSFLLASPFIMCIYILGFFGHSSGERFY